MNATLQDTFLKLFEQVGENPDMIPPLPIDDCPQDSEERRLLAGFRDMLENIQRSRQQAEEQLREKEAQYRSIFEATTDGFGILDLEDGHVVEANPAACMMYGFSYEEFIGLPPSAYLPPERLPGFLENALPLIKAGGKRHTQGLNLRKDGTTFFVDVHQTAFTYQGKRHMLVVVRDITEQKRVEQELREKEEQYRSIFEATTDGLFVSDLESGRVVEVNPAGCKQLGYSYEELIGLHPIAFIQPDSHFVFEDSLQTIKAGGKFQGRGVNMRKDGTPYNVEVHTSAFTYKGKPHVLGVVRDITEQIEYEKRLREQEEQYRAIFEASTDGLEILDFNGYIVEANPAACKMYGYSYEDMIGLHASALTSPEYLPLLAEALQVIQAGGQFQTQGPSLRKDGTFFQGDARGTPFTYKGKPHILGIVRDITERVEAEEQLREREAQYRSIFEATTDGLFIYDLETGRLVEVNPAGCQMHGFTYEEFLTLSQFRSNDHPEIFVHPDARPAFDQFLHFIKEGKAFQAQTVSVRKDGTVFPIEIHGTSFMYKGKHHGMAVIRDITEQLQAKQLLEQRVEARTRELRTLLEVSHNVASTLQLKPLLGLILDQLKMVVDFSGASINRMEEDGLVIIAYRGFRPQEQMVGRRLPLKQNSLIWQKIVRQEPVIIDDVGDETLLARAYQEVVGDMLRTSTDEIVSWMAVPLTLKDRAIGMLTFTSKEPGYFAPRHAALALAIANQAAVAIENARLYERAQELAALEERQKLARELHDSVSQALYGISLGAHAARTALDRDPSQLAEPLDYVLSMAEAALAEMRALIFELRPESLETEGLVSALTKQASSLHARHNIIVSTEFCNEPELPLKAKQELYRIAQEALHNTIKHAHAHRVDLQLEMIPKGVVLEVRDDGVGFDSSASFPGHLGLHSMRERVANLGGTIEIKSAPGDGTRITVRIPSSA